MASSSSTASQLNKYDVFINFRGEDVRTGFLSHLHEALRRTEIDAFVDENLDRGEDISSSLLGIIDESYVAVVIFSENYAYSPWCLDELAKILECKKTKGQMVLPVFYRVDPTHVQELTGNFGDAINRHREESLYRVDCWCEALTEIAGMAGLVSHNNKSDSRLIGEIVSYILEKLSLAFPSDSYDDGLVGIDSRVQHVESLLGLGSADVRVVGIWGMGGIGKTTVARQVFDRIYVKFTGRCFVANVRERLEKCTSDNLQSEILSKLSGTKTLSKHRLSRKKILIVLDDVNDLDQVELLIGKHPNYGPGSRIIMTSRDKQLLRNMSAQIYEVEKLNNCEALCLFCMYAFKQKFPRNEYLGLSKVAIDHAQGIPLALKVLGSNLYGRSEEEWEDELEKLKDVSDEKMKKILRISYDGLSDDGKEIFLAMACFFKGGNKHRIQSIMDAPGSKIGISRLIDRSLISFKNNFLHVHDLLQQMGKDIIREEKQLGKRRWLWHPKDIYNVLARAEGTEAIKGISLDMSTIREINLSPTTFERMYYLKFLKFTSSCRSEIKVFLPQGLDFLPLELRLLHWHQFPLKFLPLGSYLGNLVELHMRGSKLEELWSGVQQLGNLKFVDLSHSEELKRIPDMSRAPNLEALILDYCESLVEISSLKYLSKLTELGLAYCSSLCTLPSFLDLKSLKSITLMNCLKLKVLPDFHYNVRELVVWRSGIEQVRSSIGSLSYLFALFLHSCRRLESLPDSICNLKSLTVFFITDCLNLNRLPENLGNLESLELFVASGSDLIQLPDSVCSLRKLKVLALSKCANLRSLPEKFGDSESLRTLLLNSTHIQGLPSSVNMLRQLRFINLKSCGLSEFPNCLCCSDLSLECLIIGWNNFESVPNCIKQLSKLRVLDFSHCKRLKYLPSEFPSLSHLYGDNCTRLKSAPSLFQLQTINVFAFANCFNLDLSKCNAFVDYFLATPLLNSKMFCFPGNKLPYWMTYQNNCGYSLSLSSTSKQLEEEDHFTYFGLCAVIDPKFLLPFDGVQKIGCTANIFTNESYYYTRHYGVEVYFGMLLNEDFLQSEHVLFWSERVDFPLYNKNIIFEFYAVDKKFNDEHSTAIVKCGVFLPPLINCISLTRGL